MATREENLKKINAELEKLSDDELEKIAGGDELVLDGVSGRFYARSKGGDVKPNVEDKNYKAHVDAIKKIPPITIIPIPMIPITQPISPPKI